MQVIFGREERTEVGEEDDFMIRNYCKFADYFVEFGLLDYQLATVRNENNVGAE